MGELLAGRGTSCEGVIERLGSMSPRAHGMVCAFGLQARSFRLTPALGVVVRGFCRGISCRILRQVRIVVVLVGVRVIMVLAVVLVVMAAVVLVMMAAVVLVVMAAVVTMVCPVTGAVRCAGLGLMPVRSRVVSRRNPLELKAR